jgi:hemolysin III
MGWLIVVAVRPMWVNLPGESLGWIAAGGLAYTGGVVFYATDRRRFFHFLWHLCVLAGTGCHFMAIWRHTG